MQDGAAVRLSRVTAVCCEAVCSAVGLEGSYGEPVTRSGRGHVLGCIGRGSAGLARFQDQPRDCGVLTNTPASCYFGPHL